MKPKLFFPILLAAASLTALLLLLMNSAASVVGNQTATASPLDEGASPSEPLTGTTPVTLPWQTVATGIDYVELHLQNPINNVYIARMDRSALSITLDTSIASGYLASGKESVSQMAARYDQAIGFWGAQSQGSTWGTRNNVVIAVNGSYYDIPTGMPQNGMVQSGWYAKRFDDLGGGSGFAWKIDRTAFIGECVYHWPEKQRITYADGFVQNFEGINIARTNHTVVIYTPQYDVRTPAGTSGTEVLVELSRPMLVISPPRAVTGTIQAVYTNTGSTPIPFDHVVVSAGKAIDDPMWAHLQAGDVISISQEIKSYNFGCDETRPFDWGKTYASLGGAFYFLKKDVIRLSDDPGYTIRAPRTAIVYDSDHIYFVVVDGRDNWYSKGMTLEEMAVFARDVLGTSEVLSDTYGIFQDGGGSSTMVVNGEVMNNTYCNNAYCYATFLPLVAQPGGAQARTEFNATDEDAPVPSQPNLPDGLDAVTAERYVANGIMMVVVEPMTTSVTFTSTQLVETIQATDLRLGPGTNYAALWDIPKNTNLAILPHPMNGVLAKGSYWWKVEYNGKQGWVKESALTPATDDWR